MGKLCKLKWFKGGLRDKRLKLSWENHSQAASSLYAAVIFLLNPAISFLFVSADKYVFQHWYLSVFEVYVGQLK